MVLPKHFEHGEDEPANVYAMVKEISSRLEEGQITVVGNGSACVVGGHAWVIKKGQRFITNSAIAAMGYDLPPQSACGPPPATRSATARGTGQPGRT